jgi:hypothetical protein
MHVHADMHAHVRMLSITTTANIATLPGNGALADTVGWRVLRRACCDWTSRMSACVELIGRD